MPSVRSATINDIDAIAVLLTEDAKARSTLDPQLWRLDDGVTSRAKDAVAKVLTATGPAKELFLVAEANQQLVGVAHGMIVAAPPIYDVKVTPGLVLDDCCTSPKAPDGTAEALLSAMETALRGIGATSFIASSAYDSPLHKLYTHHDYEPVTLYMAKHGFTDRPLPPDVRLATNDDIPGIVTLSAAHRKTLQEINDRFWHIHPEADARFGMWMRYSLTLKDRDMYVATAKNGLAGYAIAQPIARLLIPLAHDAAHIGVVDDFYDTDFAAIEGAPPASSAVHLLSAAETSFAKRGFPSALVVCPANWESKRTVLTQNGYKPAKVWLLKK